MTREECETQVFLLSGNKHPSLSFGRAYKWETVEQEEILKDGKIVVNRFQYKEIDLNFLCVPKGWSLKKK